MENAIKIIPLAAIVIGVVYVVFKGLARKPHDKGNIRGGGPGDDGGGF